jgi:GntR family transcriptional repressor for pyruvate dehydrogenase complex
MLGVSRSSVREAVRELWLKGLVDRRQGQGTYVTSNASGHDSFLRHVNGRLGEIELTIVNVLDYRAALEPAIAARAAERARPADLSRLRDLWAQMEAEASPAKCSALDAAFHAAIAEATSNPLLIEVVRFSSSWLDETRLETLQSKQRRALSVASHRAVLEAISAGDPVAASAAMARHIQEVSSFVDRRLAQRRRTQESG